MKPINDMTLEKFLVSVKANCHRNYNKDVEICKKCDLWDKDHCLCYDSIPAGWEIGKLYKAIKKIIGKRGF